MTSPDPDPVEPPQDELSPGITSVTEFIGKGQPGGVCELNNEGTVPLGRIPASLGGNGGIVETEAQVADHSLISSTTNGLSTVYPEWARVGSTFYYTSPYGTYRDTEASPIRSEVTADYYVYTSATPGVTQWAEVQIADVWYPTSAYGGVVLRCRASGRNGGIVVAWNNTYLGIGTFGTSTDILWLRQAIVPEMDSGKKLRAHVDGDTVRVSIDGAAVLSYSGQNIQALGENPLNTYSGIFALNKCWLKNFKVGTVATPMRVNDPLAVHLQSNYVNSANTDMYAGGNWQRVIGPNIFRAGGESGLGGHTPYSRCVIPTSGWYRVELGVQSIATTGTAAAKIMARTGSGAPVVTSHSIASALGNAGGEGTPLYCTSTEYFPAGTVIYWSTWTSVNSTIPVAAFGGIKSRFILIRIA